MMERTYTDTSSSSEMSHSLEGGRRPATRRLNPSSEGELSRIGHIRRSLMTRRQKNSRAVYQRGTYNYTTNHCGDATCFEDTYSFWTSKPALAIVCFLILAITFQNTEFLFGALLVFTYEVALVLAKWCCFILHHPRVEECVKLTKFWFHFSLHQAERFLDSKDRARKAAVGAFLMNYRLTSHVMGGYFQARQDEVTKQTIIEGKRVQSQLDAVTSLGATTTQS